MKKPDKNPVSVRLGDLKPFLYKEAVDNKRSLHWWIKNILEDYKKKKQSI